MKCIFLFGIQRTGTNFLQSILESKGLEIKNIDYKTGHPLHKHSRLYKSKNLIPEPNYLNDIVVSTIDELEQITNTNPDLYLVISKDPYSWSLSYENWAINCKWPKVKHDYILEWNEFYKTWIELSKTSNKVLFLKYEDLLLTQSFELSKISSLLNIELDLQSHLPSRVDHSLEFTKQRWSHYAERTYLNLLDSKRIKSISNLLDEGVMSHLGYNFL